VGGKNVIVNGMYHSLDGGQTWLQNSGTPFENLGASDSAPGLTDQQILDRARRANTSLVDQQQQATKDLSAFEQQNQVSLVKSREAYEQNVARVQEQASNNNASGNSFGPGSGGDPGISFLDRLLPLIQSDLQRLNLYEQIKQQQQAQAYQRALAQQQAAQGRGNATLAPLPQYTPIPTKREQCATSCRAKCIGSNFWNLNGDCWDNCFMKCD
jgi:hypothetical protein